MSGGGGGSGYWCQVARPDRWPAFGQGDLELGHDGPPGAKDGGCSRYGSSRQHTYTAAANEVCGGYTNWGSTDVEVWFPVAASSGH